MPIAVDFNFPGATAEQYDAAIKAIGHGPSGSPHVGGALFHWAAVTSDGVRVVDVWESREQFRAVLRGEHRARRTTEPACRRRMFSSSTFTATSLPDRCAALSTELRGERGDSQGFTGIANPLCQWGEMFYRPRTSIRASSTTRSSLASRRPANRPRRCGSTTVVCSRRTRVSCRSRVIAGRKLVGRALVEVGAISTVERSRNSSAWTITA